MHVTTTDFRAALGAFATGVCVAATRDAAGAPAGVTVNSFASVSLEPPLVLFCLGRGGTALARFSAAPSWAIHVLADNQRDLARREIETGCPQAENGPEPLSADAGRPACGHDRLDFGFEQVLQDDSFGQAAQRPEHTGEIESFVL